MTVRALILTGRLHQDIEAQYPYYALQQAGYAVGVATTEHPEPCLGITGLKLPSSQGVSQPELVVGVWDLLVLPGGVKAMEHMRLNPLIIQFIADFHVAGGVIGCICSGAQLLISAKLCKGRNISGYYAMKDDIENAGAVFIDAPAVAHDRIVTSPHYKYLGTWMKAVLLAVAANKNGWGMEAHASSY